MRRSFIGGIHFGASKSVTFAASIERQSWVSKSVTGAMPVRPCSSESLNVSSEVPNGETAPIPTTRTRRCIRADVTIGPMPHQRSRHALHALALVFFATCTAVVACVSIARAQSPQNTPSRAFDELYQRGQKANGGLKTLTARFIETTTSPLLTKPLVARGTLALQRPSTVVLQYDAPEARTVIIDDKQLIISWPGRNIYQTRNIGQMQGRIQKYFVEGNPDELRKRSEERRVGKECRSRRSR